MKTLRKFRRGGEPLLPSKPPSLELSTKPKRNHCNRSNPIELRNLASQNNPCPNQEIAHEEKITVDGWAHSAICDLRLRPARARQRHHRKLAGNSPGRKRPAYPHQDNEGRR